MRFIYTLFILLLFSLQVKSQHRSGLSAAGVQLRFYPNPATTQITFDFSDSYDKNFSFQVYSFIGKKVFDLPSLNAPKTTIDLADFLRGVYIFQLKDKNGRIVESGRFQVSK